MQIGIFLANGFEEVEALTTVDLLRRAGIEVTIISIHDEPLAEGAHSIKVATDVSIGQIDGMEFDGLVLPGGMPGTLHLQENETVCRMVKEYHAKGRLIASICAAPTVFGYLGLLEGKDATCYPGMEDGLVGANHKTDSVVEDGNIITSRGIGTAIDFSAAIIRYLLKDDTDKKLMEQIVYNK